MDKKLKILISVLIILVIAGPIIFFKLKDDSEKKSYIITNDSLAFKEEYEKLNGKLNSNDKEYTAVELPSYVPVEYTSYEEVFNIIEKGTGVIYFGFPECPWCRHLTPVLSKAAIDYGLDKIYYLNNKDDRNVLSLNKKNKVITDEKGTEDYQELLKVLDEHLPVYRGLKDDKIKRLYFPTVLFVKDGKVLGIEQSLSSFSERVNGDSSLPMSNEEKTELTNIFTEYFKQIQPKKNQ